jgi:hypothetical protein
MLGYREREMKSICLKGESPFGRKGEVWLSWEKFRPISPSSLTPGIDMIVCLYTLLSFCICLFFNMLFLIHCDHFVHVNHSSFVFSRILFESIFHFHVLNCLSV